MINRKGVDVSSWQGFIDWAKAKNDVDFSIIRAGYGANNLDNRAIDNIDGCESNNIPYGLYWFSYALNEEMARKEANYICDIADTCNATYPIAYDWEEDSENYAKKNGVIMSDDLREKFAIAFLEQVKKRGYIPMIYCNGSDISGAYKNIYKKYDVWYSAPGSDAPAISCDILQNSWWGHVDGIYTQVDTNICYKDYINQNKNDNALIDKLVKEFGDQYMKLADDVIIGKYETGSKRREMIEALGYDYDIVQSIVNYKLLGK